MKNLNKIIFVIALSLLYSTSYSQIRVENDVVYATVRDNQNKAIPLKLDIYAPVHVQEEKIPVVILVHGGGFAMGDKQQKLYIEMAYRFARENYLVLSVNYRLKSKKEPFSKELLDRAVSDVNSAIRWIVKNKKKYNADVARVLICGDSAGGALVVNTVFQEKPPVNFIGCIDLWGGLPDYGLPGTENWDEPIDKYLNLKGKLMPVCIVHGTADSVIPYQTSLNFEKNLLRHDIRCEFHLLRDAGHYPEERSEEFIELIFAFADKIMSYKPVR